MRGRSVKSGGEGNVLAFLNALNCSPAFFKKKGYVCTDTKALDLICLYNHKNSTKISDRLKVKVIILIMVCTLNLRQK